LSLPIDPKTLPQDPEKLQKIVVDLTAQLDRTERLLRQLLQAKTGRKSEQLSREQLALFAAELGMSLPEADESDDHDEEPPGSRAGANHYRGISSVSGSNTTCRNRRSAARSVIRICARSAKKSASATNIFPRR
jgi:hypothetical protein